MPVPFEQIPLSAYLEAKDAAYYGRILDLRDRIRDWLSYIPQTFPHYTRHTIEHSEEIILQISKLLFAAQGSGTCVLQLSSVEAYILATAAFLHDAGMVTSDAEKEKILQSSEWQLWVTAGGGSERWAEIARFRDGNAPDDETVRHFIADREKRFLIAEFVRKTHHLRAADVIDQHNVALSHFDFGDPMLRQMIKNVCVAHGLRPHELEDQERFPDRCDIRGEPANIRLLAVLLRLGDLLDLNSDRACPLLLNAASPLPANSLAEWSRHTSIRWRLTATDRIALLAECQMQEEHRLLRDWCQWIVDEVREARTVVARFTRHNEWDPPVATMNGVDPTIVIRPADTATYIPTDWTLQLDQAEVFDRLINDVYDSPLATVRELIQNALDASRCQMYLDLARDGLPSPDYPTEVDEERRAKYPVHVSLSPRQVRNALSGEVEERQVISVEDSGIGMDRDVIERFFLQIGRSFYRSDEFRRSYRFIPTSRFGLGFLSVFAVSDYVIVETYKPSSTTMPGALRLTLTGPRNYLLLETGGRTANGTRIEVLLRETIQQGDLTEAISRWC